MIQISDTKYINKHQILYIESNKDCFEIYMTTGKFYVYTTSWEYYINIRRFLEGNNES